MKYYPARTHIMLILLLAVMSASITGCSSVGAYLGDRSRDLGDVFTLSVGVGGGAAVKTGVFSFGLLGNSDKAGLRAGSLFASTKQGGTTAEQTEVILYGKNIFHTDDTATRGKSISEITLFSFGGLPTTSRIYPNFFQFEAVVAAGPSVRAGFNAAELLDFVLGWTSIDILNDDMLLTQLKNAENQKKMAN